MEAKHYREEISAYTNGELGADERRLIEDHLAACIDCRRDWENAAFASDLASRLQSAEAPERVWARISGSLDGEEAASFTIIPSPERFSHRKALAFAIALIAVAGLASAVFLNLFTRGPVDQASMPTQPRPETGRKVIPPAPAETPTVEVASSDVGTTSPEGFAVEALAGNPVIEGGSGRMGVGQFLETDSRSTARIAVADIGTVVVSPNSRVRLAETGKDEHRLELQRGKLHARIFAPPRLFVVDTPSAKAVDLGCEYTLDVDKNGDSVLHVTSGWVALERGGRESIVPAGMMCKTRKGRGLGTPFSTEATDAFKQALESFDFSRGGSAAVQTMIREAEFYDMFTLWHLLSRVAKNDRLAVYERLAEFVPPPAGTTREGILALDKKMLEAWKSELETAWFE